MASSQNPPAQLAPPQNPASQLSSSQDPALQFSVMCLDMLEEKGQPPTLQYLFYDLPLPSLPYRMDRFHVVNCWTCGHGQHRQSVKILGSMGMLVETGEQVFVLEDPLTPQLMINVFADVTFPEAGQYWVQIFLNGALVLQYPLTVRRAGVRIQPSASEARVTRFSPWLT